MAVLQKYLDRLTAELNDPAPRPALTAWLAGLYALGALHWVYFFRYGNLRLFVQDWLKEHFYLAVLKEAVTAGRMPYVISEVLQKTDRFLANPEVMLTPDVLLLRWLPIPLFALLHVLLFYSLGFWGFARLRRRFGWPPLAAGLFFGLFTFGGAFTARFGIGHLQWAGAFLLTWFAEFVFQWLEAAESKRFALRPALAMSLLLYLLYLNGSFHIANWCLLFLALLTLTRPRLLPYSAATIPLAFVLAAHRLAPAFVTLREADRNTFGGFPSAGVLLDAFTRLIPFDADPVGLGGEWGLLWWWEYDLYLGWAGLAVLLLGLAAFARRGGNLAPLAVPTVGLFVLALGKTWSVFPELLKQAERVPGRFMLVVLLFLLVGAAETAGALQRRYPRLMPWALLAALGWAAWDLWRHSRLWRIALLEGIYLTKKYDPNVPPIHILPNVDAGYQSLVLGSLAVSAVALALVLAALWRSSVSSRP
ncbi:MAG: hypothetical protein HYZ26_14050 [Chloroflexi bacterium]|nr:hypothetical protein [Chloroflexota bacterium]